MWNFGLQDIRTLDLFDAVTIEPTAPVSGVDRELWLDLSTFTWNVWWDGAWRPIGAAGPALTVGTIAQTFPIVFSQTAVGNSTYAGTVAGTAASLFTLTFSSSASGSSTTAAVGDATSLLTLTFSQAAAGTSVPTVTGTAVSSYTVAFAQSAVGSFAAAAGDYDAEVLADNPFAWWRLAEISGTNAADEGATYDGTHANSPTLNVAGPVAAAVGYAPTAQTSLTTLGTFGANLMGTTFEMWVRIAASQRRSTVDTLMGVFNDGNNMGLQINLNADVTDGAAAGSVNLWVRGQDGAGTRNRGWAFNGDDLFDNAWHHLVWTLSDATSAAGAVGYLDGASKTLTSQQGSGGSPVTFANFEYPLGMAARNVRGVFGRHVTAQLAEPAVYTTALSAARVAAHYAAGI